MVVRNIALESNQVKQDELAVVASARQLQILRDFGPRGASRPRSTPSPGSAMPPTYYPMIVRDDIGIGGRHPPRSRPHPVRPDRASNGGRSRPRTRLSRCWATSSGTSCGSPPRSKPDQGEVEYLVEVCDPSEAVPFSYRINGVVVSDFYRRPSTR